MERLREIDSINPGFMRCVINLAANSAVGVSSDDDYLTKWAKNYVKAKRAKVKNSLTKRERSRILINNGIELSKVQEIDKFHAGFSDCVFNLVCNPETENLKYEKDILRRAKIYIRNKRNKADNSQAKNLIENKFDVPKQTKFEMRRGWNHSSMISVQEALPFGGVKNSEGSYEFEMSEESKELFKYGESDVPTKVTYSGPVFNNCTFGRVPSNYNLTTDICEKTDASNPGQSKKRGSDSEVPGKKKKFKTSEELGLRL